jgi:hypothetical protein
MPLGGHQDAGVCDVPGCAGHQQTELQELQAIALDNEQWLEYSQRILVPHLGRSVQRVALFYHFFAMQGTAPR